MARWADLNRRVWWIAAAVVLAFSLTACGDGGGSNTEPTPTPDPEPQPDPNPDPMPECGDGTCDEGETPESCPDDCEEEGPCGDQAACLDEFGAIDNSLCEVGTSCMEGCCVPQFRCMADADCEARSGTDVNCQDDRLDCVCDTDSGQCFTQLCSSNSDCGEEICVEGACVEAPDMAGLVARIVDIPRVVVEGEEVTAVAVAVDPDNPGAVVEGASFEWSTADGDVVAVDNNGLLTGGATTGTAVITAKVAGNAADPGDTATVRNMEAPQDVGVRVSAFDESTMAPIEGATVIVHGPEPFTATTGADGSATLADVTVPFSATVLAEGFNYVTVLGSENPDLLIPLPARVNTNIELDPVERELVYDNLEGVDVIEGNPSFAQVLNPGELEIALTGFGLGSGLLDLNFDLIVGPSVEQYLPANTGLPLPTDDPIDIPGGVTLFFNRQPVVERFVLVGPAGEQTMWSLGGRVSLIENPNLVSEILGSVGGNIDIGQIVAAVLPFFANFYSGFERGVQLGDGPQLPPRQIDVGLSVPTGLSIGIETPELPSTDDTAVDGVVYLGGILSPREGFLPTGITAALDAGQGEDADGFVDPVDLNMSPAHSGLQGPGSRYVVVVVGLSFDTVGGGDGREATSVIIAGGDRGAPLPAKAALPREDFLGFADQGSFDPETRALTTGDIQNADLIRAVIEGEGGLRWIVWGGDALDAEALPDPAEFGFEDPSTRDNVRLELLDTSDGPNSTLDAIAGARGRDLTEIIDLIDAFSIIEL